MISARELVSHWEKTANDSLGVKQMLGSLALMPASSYLSGHVAQRMARDDDPETRRIAKGLGRYSGLLGATTGATAGFLASANSPNPGRNMLLGSALGTLTGAGLGALAGRFTPTLSERQESMDKLLAKLKGAGISLSGYLQDQDEMNRRLSSLGLSQLERNILSSNLEEVFTALED